MKRAYRLRSRVLHPDKRPDVDPAIAAEEFNRLNIAYEVLLDPAARLAAMEKFKAEQARKARQGAYEGKRKAMVDELERREQEGKKARRDEQDRIRERERTLEKLREEGKRLREEKDRKRAEMEASVQHETQPPPETAKTTVNVGPEPELGKHVLSGHSRRFECTTDAGSYLARNHRSAGSYRSRPFSSAQLCSFFFSVRKHQWRKREHQCQWRIGRRHLHHFGARSLAHVWSARCAGLHASKAKREGEEGQGARRVRAGYIQMLGRRVRCCPFRLRITFVERAIKHRTCVRFGTGANQDRVGVCSEGKGQKTCERSRPDRRCSRRCHSILRICRFRGSDAR